MHGEREAEPGPWESTDCLKTLLLSAVARQFMIQGEGFLNAHPNDWLVWEAGVLNAPRGNVATAVTVSEGLDLAAALPRAGDPLCFLLENLTPGAVVTVGRADTNDVVLSDETVSRHHCTLRFEEKGWSVSVPDPTVTLEVAGLPVPYGRFVEIGAGEMLTLGNLTLSLHSAQSMVARLAAKLNRR